MLGSRQILLIEDSPDIKDLIEHILASDFKVVWAANIHEAQQWVAQNQFDLIILDVELPDGDGFSFYSSLITNLRHALIPVIFLTAKNDIRDKVLAFSLGAEDYLTKPFQPIELKARVELRIKKAQQRQQKNRSHQIGHLEIDFVSQRVYSTSSRGREDQGLTTVEFKLISYLALHEDQVLTRNQILDEIWGAAKFLSDRSIDSHIYSLRKKLGELGHYIQSVYGAGYRFSLTDNSHKELRQRRTGS